MLKSAAELGDCNEELEQAEKCMLPECRKCDVRALLVLDVAKGHLV